MVESLPILLDTFQSRGGIQGISIQGVFESINVLQTANETLLFLQMTPDMVERVQRYLLIFLSDLRSYD